MFEAITINVAFVVVLALLVPIYATIWEELELGLLNGDIMEGH